MTPGPNLAFVPVWEDHFPMLRQWLAEPHVRMWWGDPEEEIALIRRDIREPGFRCFVVEVDGEALAYIQHWNPVDFAANEPWGDQIRPGDLGVDMLIGPPQALGRGLGSAILRAFTERLFAEGAQRILIDPAIDNARAVRAYEKAGFAPARGYLDPKDPRRGVLLMTMTKETLSEQES